MHQQKNVQCSCYLISLTYNLMITKYIWEKLAPEESLKFVIFANLIETSHSYCWPKRMLG